MKKPLTLLFISVALVCALGADAPKPKADEVKLRHADYDQMMETVESHEGRVVVMDCWSTWCPPCVEEFPRLVKLHQKYGPKKKVACISVSFDYDGTGEPEDVEPDVLAFLQEQKATFDNILASEDTETLLKKLDLPSIPAVYVFDQKGKLAKRFDDSGGKFTYDDVEKLVSELLK